MRRVASTVTPAGKPLAGTELKGLGWTFPCSVSIIGENWKKNRSENRDCRQRWALKAWPAL